MKPTLARIVMVLGVGIVWWGMTGRATAAIPGEVVDWGDGPTERQREVIREYAEAFWAAWDAHEGGVPSEFNFVWPEDVQPGEGFDPFYLSVETLSAVYIERLVVDGGAYTYDIYDLMRDDPEVFEAFRHHTLTGELVTPLTQQQAAFRHFLLQMVPQDDFSEINGDDEDPCTDGYIVFASGGIMVNGSTISSEIDVMKKPKPCPPGDGGVPPSPDDIREALRRLIDDSDLNRRALDFLRDDRFMDPGFDCDDFATAFAHWVERHFPTDLGDPQVVCLWLNWLGDGHVVVVIEVAGKYYVVDPMTGSIKGPFESGAAAIEGAWQIISDDYLGKSPWPRWQTWRDPDARPLYEPGPWHTDPEEVDRVRSITDNDPAEYMPVE